MQASEGRRADCRAEGSAECNLLFSAKFSTAVLVQGGKRKPPFVYLSGNLGVGTRRPATDKNNSRLAFKRWHTKEGSSVGNSFEEKRGICE